MKTHYVFFIAALAIAASAEAKKPGKKYVGAPALKERNEKYGTERLPAALREERRTQRFTKAIQYQNTAQNGK